MPRENQSLFEKEQEASKIYIPQQRRLLIRPATDDKDAYLNISFTWKIETRKRKKKSW